MNGCIERLNEVLSFILKRDIILKSEENKMDIKGKYIEIEAGGMCKLFLETEESDIDTIAHLKKSIEKIIEFETANQEEQMLKQAKENFVNDVVHFRFDNIDSMLSRSEILDFDFYIKRTAIILEIQDMYILFKDKNELILQQLKEDLYKLVFNVFGNEKDIISYAGSNRFVICKAEDENMFDKILIFHEKLKDAIDVKIKLAIGDFIQ